MRRPEAAGRASQGPISLTFASRSARALQISSKRAGQGAAADGQGSAKILDAQGAVMRYVRAVCGKDLDRPCIFHACHPAKDFF